MSPAAPTRIGLVGAGHWAEVSHAPMHLAGEETTLVGVWSPTFDHASGLAGRLGVAAYRSYDDLLASVDAVDFAIAPAAQGALAVEAARAGRPMILEKPLADSLAWAERLALAVHDAGVASLVVFTNRYHPRARQFLAAVSDLETRGALLAVTGRYVGSRRHRPEQQSGWRGDLGVLSDFGPHLFDLVLAAAGPIVSVSAASNRPGVVQLTTEHASGCRSQLLVSDQVGVDGALVDLEVYGIAGHLSFSTAGMDYTAVWPEVRREFFAAVSHGTSPTADVDGGLRVQRVIDAAARSLRQDRPVATDTISAS
jgi:predicted dehydrogenase